MTARATRTAPYDWRFDSGRLCLDLVATADVPWSTGRQEPLAGEGGLGSWLVGARLVPAGTPLAAVDGRWVERFVELRGRLGQLVRAEIDGRFAESALERVNTLAAGAPPAVRAVRDSRNGTLVWTLATAPECGQLLAAVARDAVELLTDPLARARLRECEGESCRRVYLDTSRGRRRRWCSSEVCGNRERVARHRRRVAATARA
ncbi:CGNR zinc finger domain-containing protein [Streptomyces sp. NPDC004609]|uniref:CGNR zinc finger domain-containing protein n=1 Tax=Streptomyces sp. NPDC004609 TaxID=3364704 RepID=UPI0036A0163A